MKERKIWRSTGRSHRRTKMIEDFVRLRVDAHGTAMDGLDRDQGGEGVSQWSRCGALVPARHGTSPVSFPDDSPCCWEPNKRGKDDRSRRPLSGRTLTAFLSVGDRPQRSWATHRVGATAPSSEVREWRAPIGSSLSRSRRPRCARPVLSNARSVRAVGIEDAHHVDGTVQLVPFAPAAAVSVTEDAGHFRVEACSRIRILRSGVPRHGSASLVGASTSCTTRVSVGSPCGGLKNLVAVPGRMNERLVRFPRRLYSIAAAC